MSTQTTVVLYVKTDMKKLGKSLGDKAEAKRIAKGKKPIGLFNELAERDIDVFKWNSSEVQNGYVRIAIDDECLPEVLEVFEDYFGNLTNGNKILVETNGQTMYVTGKDENGNDMVLGCSIRRNHESTLFNHLPDTFRM
jgi:hypothetical protein